MALRNMIREMNGIPKFSSVFAQTLINRALEKIQDESAWSFQLGESGWFTPGIVGTVSSTTTSAGTITTALFSDQIVGDATASAAWAAIPATWPLTVFQIRIPAYAIYSVIDFQVDTPSAGLTTLTIDRPWMEPYGAGRSYQMYQCYFPAPSATFKRWLAVRDFTNAANLNWWEFRQKDTDALDPQRTIFNNPARVVPYRLDTRPGSSTLGRMLFELYPGPLASLPYALYYVQNAPPLVNPSDMLPAPLTEEVVLYRAKSMAYLWAEENKGRYPELQKSDWGFLAQAQTEFYKDRLKDVRKVDRDLCDSFLTKIIRKYPTIGGPFYSAITQQGSVGTFG